MTERVLSHYKLFEEISRGGMGIVYRAVDSRLDREVALKVLPAELVSDPDRKRRFVQEAKAAAALHHPNIATIFEIDEEEDTTFIAMELIRGEQLSEMRRQGPPPLDRILRVATEIVEGLARAHDKGIVHRDLKPGNIMLTEDDHAKIIDFGLAKLIEPLGSGDSGDSTEDTAFRQTEAGKILGTLSYMSPEQARGKQVDHRSDIFSLGIVLFEMVTGRVPFAGPSGVETLNAILKEPTPALIADAPHRDPALASELERIIQRCLAKDPEERYQTAKDLLSELRRMRRDSESLVGGAAITEPATSSKKAWIAAAAGVAIVAAAAAYFVRPRTQSVPQLTNPVQVTSAVGTEVNPTWSPEGGRLAYQNRLRGGGNSDIWVTQLGGGQAVNFTADYQGNDYDPSWSPDGSEIAFASRRDGGGYFVMSALGGPPRKVLGSVILSTPQWSADGLRLACLVRNDEQGSVEVRNDEQGSVEVEILTLQSRESERVPLGVRLAVDMSWSSDERFFAYVDAVDYTAEITQVWVTRASDGEAFAVTDATTQDWSPSWSADGQRLYFVSNRGGSMDLWQQRIGSEGAPVGEPERVTTGVGMRSAAFSPDGSRLAYTRGRGIVANIWRVPILRDRLTTWSDAQQLTFDEAFIEFLDLSPDGDRLVFSSDRLGNQDLWTMPASGGEAQPLNDDPGPDWRPTWSPDGKRIAFYSYRSGNRDIWWMPLDGGPPQQVTKHEASDLHPSWSPDGQQIAFASLRKGGGFTVWAVLVEGGDARIVADEIQDNLPAWSPDGEWIAFRSGLGRTGARSIWRVPADGGDAEQLSQGGGGQPRWTPDGKEIYFASLGQRGVNIWGISLEDRTERAFTDLQGRPGNLGAFGLATDGEFLYFTWDEDVGDLWVMDVVTH